MIIYTDSQTSVFGTQITPAHTHAATTDFSNILDDLANGNIPCGTGEPFPVNWSTDQPNVQDANRPPWVDRTVYEQQSQPPGFFNPWANIP